jgi:carboxyl-terminal processing protease
LEWNSYPIMNTRTGPTPWSFPVPRRVVVILACLLASSLWALPAPAQDKKTDPLNGGLAVLEEALAQIQEHAFKPPPPGYLVQEAVRSYLKRFDPYADYLSPQEYQAYLKAQNPDYGGLGMDIVAAKGGGIICRPFPGSPAEFAGIEPGETLLAVNGKPVADRSVFVVGTAIRGRTGSQVVLELSNPAGRTRKVTVKRTKVSYKSVLIVRPKLKPVIKIFNFTPNTPDELRKALQTIGPGRPKIIDLRGNSGGDLAAAGRAAGIFLSPGKKLFSLKTNKESKTFRVEPGPGPMLRDKDSKVIIWQDQATASSAEAFIAALIQNSRAVSVGVRSLGKGVVQRIVRMSDGSAMFITYALILPPGGRPYHPAGLDPTHSLKETLVQSYLLETARLLGSEPKKMIIKTGPGG